eukprot:6435877-Prymnesium_polylepis.1
MRKSGWRSYIRRAGPNLAAYALPMPRIFLPRVTWPIALCSGLKSCNGFLRRLRAASACRVVGG